MTDKTETAANVLADERKKTAAAEHHCDEYTPADVRLILDRIERALSVQAPVACIVYRDDSSVAGCLAGSPALAFPVVPDGWRAEPLYATPQPDPKPAAVEVTDSMVERAAAEVYAAMRFCRESGSPEWVPNGNSDAQEVARRTARVLLAAALQEGRSDG